MPKLIAATASTAFLIMSYSATANAEEPTAGSQVAIASAVINPAPVSSITPPSLKAFDGIHHLAQEASRQRIQSQELGYTVSVDSQGNVSDCTLDRNFRRKATKIALCRPLIKYLKFEPALDAQGNAVAGFYSSTFYFIGAFTESGNITPD